MKYYLSSYKFGNDPAKLPALFGENKRIGLIPNAIDFSSDLEKVETSRVEQIQALRDLGLEPVLLDLKAYFENPEQLEETMQSLGGVWVRGGNTFVLRTAYLLSGFDRIITERADSDPGFVYAGYSAGICVIQPTLHGIELVDDPDQVAIAYGESAPLLWDGLSLIEYNIAPHYKSDHPETGDVDRVVAFYDKEKMPYKTLRDGEVIITA